MGIRLIAVRLRTIRPWLARAGLPALVLALLPACSRSESSAPLDVSSPPPLRPNIVFIMADDLGWDQVGYHDSAIRTPHIDRLAASGVRLEQFYAMPSCTPSRAALMTGRYPTRYGLKDRELPLGETTLAECLKAVGYHTAICGKWHLGTNPGYRPQDRGFDHQYGAYGGYIDYFELGKHGEHDWRRNGDPIDEDGYATELIAREAVRVIESHAAAERLFLYVPFNAPHTPLQAPERYERAYDHVPDALDRTFAAMVTSLDDGVGAILDALDRRGMRQSTVVIFCSDNGPVVDRFRAASHFRDGKLSVYEGGVRVPALVSFPGHIAEAGAVDEPVHMVDWLPTLARLAGFPLPAGTPLDGEDIWGTITRGEPSPHQELLIGMTKKQMALRRGDWKLVFTQAQRSVGYKELYNLAADPYETKNLADDRPALADEMFERLLTYQIGTTRTEPAHDEP